MERQLESTMLGSMHCLLSPNKYVGPGFSVEMQKFKPMRPELRPRIKGMQKLSNIWKNCKRICNWLRQN